MRLDTIDPADTVEFCPHQDASNILVCGTYKLLQADATTTEDQPTERTPQKRIGSVLVFELKDDDEMYGFPPRQIYLVAHKSGLKFANSGHCPSCGARYEMVRFSL